MKNGDLSNQSGYVIAFRCEDCLISFETEGLKNKAFEFFSKISGYDFRKPVINEDYLKVMEYLYKWTSYNVDLVIQKENYTDKLKECLDGLPFGRIVLFERYSELSARLLTGDLTLYVDEDAERRSLVNSQYAVSLNELNNFLRRHKE